MNFGQFIEDLVSVLADVDSPLRIAAAKEIHRQLSGESSIIAEIHREKWNGLDVVNKDKIKQSVSNENGTIIFAVFI